VHNYSSASSSCIILRTWYAHITNASHGCSIFNLVTEMALCDRYRFIKELCYAQAVIDVNQGRITAGHDLYKLKAQQDITRMDQVCTRAASMPQHEKARRTLQYLQLVRAMPGYGTVIFPHSQCNFRKDGGHVAMEIAFDTLRWASVLRARVQTTHAQRYVAGYTRCPLAATTRTNASRLSGRRCNGAPNAQCLPTLLLGTESTTAMTSWSLSSPTRDRRAR